MRRSTTCWHMSERLDKHWTNDAVTRHGLTKQFLSNDLQRDGMPPRLVGGIAAWSQQAADLAVSAFEALARMARILAACAARDLRRHCLRRRSAAIVAGPLA